MRQTLATRTTTIGILRSIVIRLAVATAAVIGTLGYQSASSSVASFPEGRPLGAPRAAPQSASSPAPWFGELPRRNHGGSATQGDGALPDGVTVFDDEYPAITNLDPDLLQALRDAATDAADDGVEFVVNSGWRSAAYQDQLLRDAVAEYGSEAEAARWVGTSDTSAHVAGDAVDIGTFDARAWLSERGADYGLCQIYRNEPWHYELRPHAVNRGCPPPYADPAHDPRMQP
jgi:D-alanyl-D-alanine carboxypeptidase